MIDDEIDKLEIHCTSYTFESIWRMEKINSSVKIKSEWKTVNGETKDKLNKLSENTILINDFAEEINNLLIFLKCSIEKIGINCNLIENYTILEKSCYQASSSISNRSHNLI